MSMDALTRLRRDRAPHRVFVGAAPVEAVRRSVLLAQGAWLGLLGGWLELGVLLGHRLLVGNVTDVSRRLHWDHAPLGVIAHLALFLPWLALALLLRARAPHSRRRDVALSALGWYLAVLSPLLAIEELYWPCAHVLAAAFALRIAPGWQSRRSAVLRRTLPVLATASTLLLLGGFAWRASSEARALAALPAAKDGAPNVVLIVLDTVRADHLSLYGYARDTTPTLRKLAERGIAFDFARSPAPWTLPAHATMFTGRWPHELSVDTDRPLDATYPTLAEFLGREGYLTGGFTANTYYTNAWHAIDRGFARYEDAVENRTISVQETLRCAAIFRRMMPWAVRLGVWPTRGDTPRRKPAAEIRRDATAWLDARGADRPFFLFLNLFDAHDLYEVPDGYEPRFTREGREAVRGANRVYFRNMKDGGDRAKADEARRVLLDVYDDCIRSMDEQVGLLLDDLDRRGRSRDTWVIVTSDHGEFFGEKGRFGHGGGLDRAVLDVPLLIVPPTGMDGSARVGEAVSTRDLPATIADAIGASARSPFPGRTLRRFWDRSARVDSASRVEDVPLSEFKAFEGPLPKDAEVRAWRFDAVIVAGDRILHENRKAPDELYRVDDRDESEDLAGRPESGPTLERLRAVVRGLLRGDR